ncbi:MAG: NUDIX domain-containing protein [Anaerolineae bacterium]|jgi:putative endonuclease|nr:NUDIX domain-containing protein [Anaerolineae bacterium]
MWYLYVLECGDGSFYTGATGDLSRRLAEHQSGRGARYTKTHPPVALLAAWTYPDRGTALRAEAAFKALPRSVKKAWVEGRWPFLEGPFAFAALGQGDAHHFCPRCGGRLAFRSIDGAEVAVCTVCGRSDYLNAKPCAGVLIVHDGAVLLVHRGIEPYKGYWDIPGGFMGADEAPQACAVREAREETGLDVHVVALLGFYMDHYPFQGEDYSILNIYFIAEAEGVPAAGDDADGLCWFPLDVLPEEIAFEHERQVLADLRTRMEGALHFHGEREAWV